MTATADERPGLTALRAQWLFDGVGETLLADPVVVLDGETIRSVQARGSVPDGAILVDLPGTTILPGLVDSHVHLAFDASADPVGSLANRDDTAAVAAMTAAARHARGWSRERMRASAR
jgi:imidazolonepropionase-like amidohydrolase